MKLNKILSLSFIMIILLGINVISFAAIESGDIASVGEEGYTTLADAITAIETHGTIEMLKNIELEGHVVIPKGKEIILDLKGKTISGVDRSTSGSYELIKNSGKLTVNDTVGGGKITYSATTDRQWNAFSSTISNQQGTVIVNGGTIEHTGGTSMAYAIDTLTNSGIGKAELTVNGGKIVSTYRAIRQFGNCIKHENILTINSGDILSTTSNKGAVWLQSSNVKANKVTLNIVGGSVSAVYVWAPVNADVSGLKVNINEDCVISKVSYGNIVAKVGELVFSNLVDALNASGTGDTITLLSDIELSEMISFNADKAVTIDLNGNVLTTAEAVKAVAEISNGSITLADSASTKGKINASNMAFRVIAGTSTSGTLIIEKDVAVFSENECAIFIKGQDATLITEGNISTTGVHAAISGNGNPENGGIKVYINGGEVISEKTAAIYFPNTTLLQITDGVFTGSVAVYQKSGKLDISGGTFIANGEKADYVYNPSGLNSTGDALVVESCNYPGGVPTVSITGGYFLSKNNQAIASYNDKGGKDTLPEKIAGFISGGYFTSDPTEFLVTGKVAVPSAEEGYLFTVADKNSEIEVETSLEVSEPVIENKTEAQISGDFEVDVETLKAEASALLNDSSVIDSEEAVAAVENLEGYVSGETVVTVVVQPYMEVEITDFVSGESLTVDITPKYNLVATISGDEELVLDGDDKNAVVLEEGKTLNVTKTIEVTIPLPQGFADGLTQVFVHHKGHIYTADIMNTASGDVAVFTNPHGFSEFSVKRTLEAVAQNTTTNEMYDTLEASINDVTNNETIMLLKANNENVVVDRIVTFVFNTNGFEYSGDITAGSTVVLEKIANDTNAAVTYAFTKKQTSPVVGGGGSSSSTYTIKFETNNGSKIENVKVEKNAKLEKPLDPTKDGYTFDGWYTDKECKVAYNFNIGVTKGFTLYAKWTENKIEGKQNTFGDVTESDWYYDAVEYVFSNKLFNGITETEFAPMMEITRAMLVTVLYRYEKEPEVSGNSKFIDVADGAYYNRAVIWAETNGIVNGISDSEFAPDNKITREQIVTIMFRFAKYKGIDVSVGEDTNILSYDDVASVSEYAIPAMQWAVGSGLMKGKTESTLNPKDTSTRAEVATILQRFIENNK